MKTIYTLYGTYTHGTIRKLTTEQVEIIRQKHHSIKDYAKMFNVSKSTISQIQRGIIRKNG